MERLKATKEGMHVEIGILEKLMETKLAKYKAYIENQFV
jgi:hypothetical protein